MGNLHLREPPGSGYRAIDVYATFEQEEDSVELQGPIGSVKSFCSRLWKENWLFLILLGVLSAFVILAFNLAVAAILGLQVQLSSLASDNTFFGCILWVSFSLLSCVICTSLVQFVSPHAAGSGIPELRSMLSGIEIRAYLSIRTFFAKTLGMITAYAAGFSIGKEGPFVHIASIICRQLTRIPFFNYIHQNDAAYLQVLAAAAAVGVTLSFGSPIGGVLFSMEVTSSFYLVGGLWRGFFVAVCGALTLSVMDRFTAVSLLLPETNIPDQLLKPDVTELLVFSAMGLGGGILGGLFVHGLKFTVEASGAVNYFTTLKGSYARAIGVCLLASTTAYFFPLMRNDLQQNMNYLMKDTQAPEWGNLVGLFFAKGLFTMVSVGFTGVPAGLYSVVFLWGAVYGRLFGEISKLIFANLVAIQPASYAIIGAAAMASGVSRTVSTVVIVIELTRQINLVLPTLLTVLIATACGNLVSDDCYFILCKQRNLPLMPHFDLHRNYREGVAELMKSKMNILRVNSTYRDAKEVLSRTKQRIFPLVDENNYFLGATKREYICKVLEFYGVMDPIVEEESPDFFTMRNLTELFSKAKAFISNKCSDGSERKELPKSKSISTDTCIVSETEDTDSDFPKHGSKQNILDSDTNSDADDAINTRNTEPILPLLEGAHNGHSNPDSVLPYLFLSRKNKASRIGVLEVDPTVMHIDVNTSLFKVHFLFTMLGLGQLFVTNRGKLVGVITRKLLIKYLKEQ